MHIPSYRVYREMRSEDASLWYVPANNGEELALLIKAPTSSIKALIAGCPLKLMFSKQDSYICIGVRILDTPDSPVIISGIQKEAEEHSALARFLRERFIPVFMYNEMDVCLAWTTLKLTEKDAVYILDCLGAESQWYTGPFSKVTSYILDCFCFSSGITAPYPNAQQIPIIETDTELEKWKIVTNIICGVDGHEEIVIDNRDEGQTFERVIWASLESIFPTTLHKNPRVKNGEKLRELTDVFSFYNFGCFLIEAKDLSVLNAGYDRNQARRIAGIQKQVKKAISQLIGASKRFMCGNDIFASDGTKLYIERNNPPHCIVLITELMCCGEWTEIVDQLIEAMQETGAFFHLLDLQELIMLLKASSGRAELFDYNLMQRCKFFVEKRSVFIKSRPSPIIQDQSNLKKH